VERHACFVFAAIEFVFIGALLCVCCYCEYQRLNWDALRKSINGLVNKVNATNITNLILELFAENLIRGRGLFCRSCMNSQMASPGFTDVFVAMVAVNTKFPEVGDLLLRRIILQLKRSFTDVFVFATTALGHVSNQILLVLKSSNC